MTEADLSRLRVLVTGASSGVGMATARRFASEGAAVALLARRKDVLRELADELGELAHAFAVDVSDPCAAAQAVDEAERALGGLDVTVNAAGAVHPASLADLDAHTWRRIIDVNLSGSFYIARESGLRMLAAGRGSIVNIGSDLATRGMSSLVHYCASKAGVVGMTKALAAELAPAVRVNAVCPGPIDTPMLNAEFELNADPGSARAAALAEVPLKRFAAPDEVVEAIRFLAIGAPFATGTILALDGGTTAF